MDFFPILIVFVILFMSVVAPLWIVMHYKARQPAAAKPTRDLDGEDVDELLDTLETLLDRVENLERILDADNPEWRKSRR